MRLDTQANQTVVLDKEGSDPTKIVLWCGKYQGAQAILTPNEAKSIAYQLIQLAETIEDTK